MSERGSGNRNGHGRRDFARFLLMVLPGFMFVGLLAPAAVSVKPITQVEPTDPMSFRNFAPSRPRQIAQLPREVATVSDSDALEVEPLFTGAQMAAIDVRQIPLPAVEADAQQGGEIVLAQEDGDDDYVSDSMFDQSGETTALRVDLKPLWDPSIFDRIPGTISKDGYTQYDDFHGNGVRLLEGAPATAPIPEPRTAAMLALGLLALAMHARRAN